MTAGISDNRLTANADHFENRHIGPNAGEVIDDHFGRGMLRTHRVDTDKISRIDQAAHRLTGLSGGLPHLPHAVA